MFTIKSIVTFTLFITMALAMYFSNNFTLMAAGIAFFFQGMHYMNSGLKAFSGGVLESTLKLITNSIWKSISLGIVTTTITQSSSVLSLIIISFLSAEIIGLYSAIGIIIGSNLGATFVAWIIAIFGIKIKLFFYALPLIIFGIILSHNRQSKTEGFGSVLLGLGFLFIGIDYLKDGLADFNAYLQITTFIFDGYNSVLLYFALGVLITVVMQSTNALMILLLTTLDANAHMYYHAVAIAIGSNIGTTATSILGALGSGINAKRLAFVHFLFNLTTALITLAIFFQFIKFNDFIALKLGIAEHSIKLVLFHTLFNCFGLVLFLPFINTVAKLSKKIFPSKVDSSDATDSICIPKNRVRAKYLNKSISYPDAALRAITKETQRLYKNSRNIICYAMVIDPKALKNHSGDYKEIINSDYSLGNEVSIAHMYDIMVKGIYSDIIEFSNKLDFRLYKPQAWELFALQASCRYFVAAIKHMKHIHKNISRHIYGDNKYAKKQYNHLRLRMLKTLVFIEDLGLHRNYTNVNDKILKLQQKVTEQDQNINTYLQDLMQDIKIESLTVTSVLNDSTHIRDACLNLLDGVKVMLDRKTNYFLQDYDEMANQNK